MRTRPFAVVLGVAGAVLAALPADAQIDETGAITLAEADLERLVANLDSDDATTREMASQALSSDPRLSLRRLERFLTGSAMSREQRRRLLSVAFQRFSDPGEPRAAMGVSFEPLPRESGVRLATVVPNFPCAAVLKPGDRVLTFDGVPVREQGQAVAMIIARDPGDEIQVALLRQGESMTVAVPLGRRDRLDNPVQASGQMLLEAWTIRSRAYTGDAESAVIEGGLAATEWTDIVGPAPEESVAVVAGGEPRGGVDPGLAGRPPQVRMDAMIIRQQPRLDRDARNPQNPIAQRRALREEVEELRAAADRLGELQRLQGLSPDQRRAFDQQIQEYAARIRERERRIQMLDAQLGRPPR